MGIIASRFDYGKLDAQLARAKSLAVGVAQAAPRKVARGFLRRVLDVTPPAGQGATGLSARRQGQRAIDRDLAKIFAPVILRGKRAEQWPDVEGIYAAATGGRKGFGIRRPATLYRVDVRKLEALRQKLYARIGTLGGGWNPALSAFNVPAPEYIRRHGLGDGTCSVVLTASGIVITAVNAVGYGPRVRDYPRQIQAALDYEAAALERELDYLLEAALRSVF